MRSFSVGEARVLAAREARHRVLGEIAAELDLAGEGQHVRREPGGEQHFRLDLASLGLFHGLVENGVERLERLHEAGKGGGLDCERHDVLGNNNGPGKGPLRKAIEENFLLRSAHKRLSAMRCGEASGGAFENRSGAYFST